MAAHLAVIPSAAPLQSLLCRCANNKLRVCTLPRQDQTPVQVIQNEGLIQRAEELGHVFRFVLDVSLCFNNCIMLPFSRRAAMLALQGNGCSFIAEVRGRGLLNAVEVDPSKVPLCIQPILPFCCQCFCRFQLGTCASKWRQRGCWPSPRT